MSDSPAFVTSPDGTSIAYWTQGSGPPLLLVHGTTSDHTTFNELVPHLASRRTVIVLDRRGRGLSGDAGSYDIEAEFADVAGVIDALAEQRGGCIDVFSHSFGCFVSLGALLRTANVKRAVVYSPGFGAEYGPGVLDRIEEFTESDDLDSALRIIFSEVIGMPNDEIDQLRASPVWKVRVEAAGTVVRECKADEAFLRRYAHDLKRVQTPVLVVSGATNSPPKRAIAAALSRSLPRCTLVDIPGQGHVAHHSAPDDLSNLSLAFLDDSAGNGIGS